MKLIMPRVPTIAQKAAKEMDTKEDARYLQMLSQVLLLSNPVEGADDEEGFCDHEDFDEEDLT